MRSKHKWFGFYSDQQSQHTGVLIYKTPDGREVAVTEVSHNPVYQSNWRDAIAVGEVTELVRREKDATFY